MKSHHHAQNAVIRSYFNISPPPPKFIHPPLGNLDTYPNTASFLAIFLQTPSSQPRPHMTILGTTKDEDLAAQSPAI